MSILELEVARQSFQGPRHLPGHYSSNISCSLEFKQRKKGKGLSSTMDNKCSVFAEILKIPHKIREMLLVQCSSPSSSSLSLLFFFFSGKVKRHSCPHLSPKLHVQQWTNNSTSGFIFMTQMIKLTRPPIDSWLSKLFWHYDLYSRRYLCSLCSLTLKSHLLLVVSRIISEHKESCQTILGGVIPTSIFTGIIDIPDIDTNFVLFFPLAD